MKARLLPLLAAALSPLLAESARAHPDGAAIAFLLAPNRTGEIIDTSFEITWSDFNRPVVTGTATVDLFYTARIPKTFKAGELPLDLEGTTIAQGIPEKDTSDRFTWDTSAVP